MVNLTKLENGKRQLDDSFYEALQLIVSDVEEKYHQSETLAQMISRTLMRVLYMFLDEIHLKINLSTKEARLGVLKLLIWDTLVKTRDGKEVSGYRIVIKNEKTNYFIEYTINPKQYEHWSLFQNVFDLEITTVTTEKLTSNGNTIMNNLLSDMLEDIRKVYSN